MMSPCSDMRVVCHLLLLLFASFVLTTNLGRLIKRLNTRLNQLVRDRYAGSLTYLSTIKDMNEALVDLSERIANPRSSKGILRLGQAVISSGTPHFVKYNISRQELQRRYRWNGEDLNQYYQLINRTIQNRKRLDSICRKVALEVKVYKYYYVSKDSKVNRTPEKSKTS